MRRDARLGRRRGALVGLTVAGLLATTTAGVAQAEDEGAVPVPVAFTGPSSYALSLQAQDPPPGEWSFKVGLSAPGEPDPDGDGSPHPIHQGDWTVTIDASSLEGVADVQLPCDAEGLVATCKGSEIYAGEVYNQDWGIGLGVSDESAAGDTGTIVVTGQGEGLEFARHTVDVLVGGPEFRMRRPVEPEGFTAGDVFKPRMAFRNVGGVAADGVVLRFTGSRGLTFPQRFSNCSYATENEDNLIHMRHVAICTFEGTFEAGAAYRVATPVKVKAADFALRDIFAYRFTALDPAEAGNLRGEGTYRKGDGKELTLERTKGGTYTKYAEVDLPSSNSYDFDLVGDRVEGAKGETVTAKVVLHNRGPAWIGALRSGGEPVRFTVQVPDGATVVQTPADCRPDEEEGGRVVSFWCSGETPFLENTTREFTFGLRIDEVIEGALGKVAFPGWEDPNEANRANDTGWIVLNGNGDEETPGDTSGTDGGSDDETPPPGEGTQGSDGGTTDGGASGSGGDDGSGTEGTGGTDTDGGSLALTGSGAMTLGGFALALLAAGGALLVVRRRRAVPAPARTDDAAA